MRKLLRADIMRLVRDKVFLVSLAAIATMGVAVPVMHYFDNLNNGEAWKPDSTSFIYAIFAPILLSLIASLFIGTEYSDGTMRNKIIVGHKRYHIYLAKLVSCVTASLALNLAYLIPHTALSLILLGGFESSIMKIILYICLNAALLTAYSSLFTLISMLCQNKAYSTACCILLVFTLLFVGISITSALSEPEYYSGYSYTENGITTTKMPEKNPNYLSGTKRLVYEFMNDFMPGGQAIQLSNISSDKTALLAVYDGIILLLTTACGIIVFRRKDLK